MSQSAYIVQLVLGKDVDSKRPALPSVKHSRQLVVDPRLDVVVNGVQVGDGSVASREQT